MLASRPSLLLILSGGSSYRTGASGSLDFFAFFPAAVELNDRDMDGSLHIQYEQIYQQKDQIYTM